MNLEQIKQYIKENENLYDEETIKKRLRNNGAKPEDIKKAYSMFSFPEFKIDNKSQKETMKNIEELSEDINDLTKNKNLIMVGVLLLFGFGRAFTGIIIGIIGIIILNNTKDKSKTKIIQILKYIAIVSIIISIFTTITIFYPNSIMTLL